MATCSTHTAHPQPNTAHPRIIVCLRLYFWHQPGPWGSLRKHVQPTRHYETAETKRRLHNLLSVSGLTEQTKLLKPRPATAAQLSRCVGACLGAHVHACPMLYVSMCWGGGQGLDQ